MVESVEFELFVDGGVLLFVEESLELHVVLLGVESETVLVVEETLLEDLVQFVALGPEVLLVETEVVQLQGQVGLLG